MAFPILNNTSTDNYTTKPSRLQGVQNTWIFQQKIDKYESVHLSFTNHITEFI